MLELLNGPLNKSIYTQHLELVAKYLLYSTDTVSAQFRYDNEGKRELYAAVGGVDVNLSLLFNKADLSHIRISQRDSAKYYYKGSTPLSRYFRTRNPNNAKLSPAERYAISGYTGMGYIAINRLLYNTENKLSQFINKLSYRITGRRLLSGHVSAHYVLSAILLGSGLSKISPAKKDKKSYRGERNTPQEEIQKRIDLINQGGGFTKEPAFMSSSIRRRIANRFGGGNCLVIFDSIYGKSIRKYSRYPGEKEYLLPPGKIFWKTHKLKNGCHIFHADVVNPLMPENDNPTEQDIASFNQLLDVAVRKGIPVDFITPHLKNEILKREIPATVAVPNINASQIKGRLKWQVAKSLALLALFIAGQSCLALSILAETTILLSMASSFLALWAAHQFHRSNIQLKHFLDIEENISLSENENQVQFPQQLESERPISQLETQIENPKSILLQYDLHQTTPSPDSITPVSSEEPVTGFEKPVRVGGAVIRQ